MGSTSYTTWCGVVDGYGKGNKRQTRTRSGDIGLGTVQNLWNTRAGFENKGAKSFFGRQK